MNHQGPGKIWNINSFRDALKYTRHWIAAYRYSKENVYVPGKQLQPLLLKGDLRCVCVCVVTDLLIRSRNS